MVELFGNLLNLVILIILEVVLGIDNLLFLTILLKQLPQQQRKSVRYYGLAGALVLRLLLLGSALTVIKFVTPLWVIGGFGLSIRDLFFILGGAFLIYKSLQEIAMDLGFGEMVSTAQVDTPALNSAERRVFYWKVVLQIMLMDLVFSFDSVLTAVGLTNLFTVMAIAIVVAILIMLYASDFVARFIHRHPPIKMLALSFLVMVGGGLFFEGWHYVIPKEHLYFAIVFALIVEILNMVAQYRKNGKI